MAANPHRWFSTPKLLTASLPPAEPGLPSLLGMTLSTPYQPLTRVGSLLRGVHVHTRAQLSRPPLQTAWERGQACRCVICRPRGCSGPAPQPQDFHGELRNTQQGRQASRNPHPLGGRVCGHRECVFTVVTPLVASLTWQRAQESQICHYLPQESSRRWPSRG